jgi:hypothetical protein
VKRQQKAAPRRTPRRGFRYVVEVLRSDGTRSIARRFASQELADDFYARTRCVCMMRANRQGHAYLVRLYRTRARGRAVKVLQQERFEPIR